MQETISNPHILDPDQVLQDVEVELKSGLSQEQAAQRLEQFGENALKSGEKVSVLQILIHNANNLIVYLLMLAAGVSFFMDEPVEGFAIIVAILIAVLSGFFTEYKAQKSIESLQKLTQNIAKVRRDGRVVEIDSSQVVVGDILFIEEGDLITADARIVQSTNFATIESALTGESEAVDKDPGTLEDEDTSLGDRKNMVFTGTAATRGNAYAVVTGTGMNTEIGKIRDLIEDDERERTPLEEQLDRLGKTLVIFSVFVAAAIVILGIANGQDAYTIIKISIVLAISSIPEALPAVSTITLAIGMGTMARHNALVKSLPAVETLGSTTVICTDKTGTLTENQMTVKSIYLSSNNTMYEVEGEGYEPVGRILKEEEPLDDIPQDLASLIRAGVLSSNASLNKEGEEYHVVGDPTEGGIVVLGEKIGITRREMEKEGYKRLEEIPFNSADKYMVTAYEQEDGERTLFIKGAPDVLCSMVQDRPENAANWENAHDRLAGEGMRVLAMGQIHPYKGDDSPEAIQKAVQDGIEILGFVGIMDPPRADVKEAITAAQHPGIRVIMITGDHPATAQIIAESIGMENIEKVITGREMDQMNDEELAEKIRDVSIFARVSPENKLQIVRALKMDHQITAMTGDGVNDAPALNTADIGIAMGIRGTEVAKDASDMILVDDQFSTIVDAVREGRIIFDNIQKFVYFLFSGNVVEILAILIATVARLPVPITALQILWLNLVVDVFPALSLAWERGDQRIMERKPRDPQDSIIDRPFLMKILGIGSLISLGALAVFVFAMSQDYSLKTSQTMAFSTMAFGQLFHLFNVRSVEPIWNLKMTLHNPYLLVAEFTSTLLMLAVIYLPFFNSVMSTTALNLNQWGYVLAGSFIPMLLVQLRRIGHKGREEVISE